MTEGAQGIKEKDKAQVARDEKQEKARGRERETERD